MLDLSYRSLVVAESASSELRTRLELLHAWYVGMIGEESGRLAYLYDPVGDTVLPDGPPLRELAALADAAALGRLLHLPDLDTAVRCTLEGYRPSLIAQDGQLIFDTTQLREPVSIAHNAFAILALIQVQLPDRDRTIRALADAIVHQQRADGSYCVYFGGEPDDGLALYPAVATLALLEAARLTHRESYRVHAMRALAWARAWSTNNRCSPDLFVFFARWQTACAAVLRQDAPDPGVRAAALDLVFTLQDRVLAARVFEGVVGNPLLWSTVQVAAALTGVCDAYRAAVQARDAERRLRYRACARTALAWLADAQRVGTGSERELGGFGNSGGDRVQRIDVAGQVAGALIKSLVFGVV